MNSFLKSILFLTSACAAASCTKDAATAGGSAGERLTLAVTIEDGATTRTCIGGKDGNVYHTCWQEGDRISLN